MRALIVDDEPTVCLLLSRILARDFDCQADQAPNGREALVLLARERYDFVLLDLLMPVMSGYETLQAIRRSPTLQHLPVMVMSTVREEARVREAIELGIASYMAKPLRPADVSARLTRIVSRLGGAGAGERRRAVAAVFGRATASSSWTRTGSSATSPGACSVRSTRSPLQRAGRRGFAWHWIIRPP